MGRTFCNHSTKQVFAQLCSCHVWRDVCKGERAEGQDPFTSLHVPSHSERSIRLLMFGYKWQWYIVRHVLRYNTLQYVNCAEQIDTCESLDFGAFAKLRKAIISFVMSVLPSVRMEQLGSHWTDFHEILMCNYFSKNFRENSSFFKIWEEYRTLYMKNTGHCTRRIPENVHEEYRTLYMKNTGHCTWRIPDTVREEYRALYMKNTGHCTWRIPDTVHEEYRTLYMKNTGHCTWRIPDTVHEEYRTLYMKNTGHFTWRIPDTVREEYRTLYMKTTHIYDDNSFRFL